MLPHYLAQSFSFRLRAPMNGVQKELSKLFKFPRCALPAIPTCPKILKPNREGGKTERPNIYPMETGLRHGSVQPACPEPSAPSPTEPQSRKTKTAGELTLETSRAPCQRHRSWPRPRTMRHRSLGEGGNPPLEVPNAQARSF